MILEKLFLRNYPIFENNLSIYHLNKSIFFNLSLLQDISKDFEKAMSELSTKEFSGNTKINLIFNEWFPFEVYKVNRLYYIQLNRRNSSFKTNKYILISLF